MKIERNRRRFLLNIVTVDTQSRTKRFAPTSFAYVVCVCVCVVCKQEWERERERENGKTALGVCEFQKHDHTNDEVYGVWL